MPPSGKLGVCGFCWSGFHSTQLCTETTNNQPLVDAQYCAHPSRVAVPDQFLAAINKVPYSMAIGDQDVVMGIDQVHALEAALRQQVGESDASYQILVYPGATHGFACRARPNHQVEIDASNRAATQAVQWFNKYLN